MSAFTKQAFFPMILWYYISVETVYKLGLGSEK